MRSCGLLLALALGGCQSVPQATGDGGESSSSTGSEQECVPGTEAECWCPEATKGMMICSDSGSWDPCDCPDVSDTTDDTGGVFSGVPDLPEGWCDIWEPNCPEGEKCTATHGDFSYWSFNECVPIMGDDEPGEPCQALEDYPRPATDTCVEGSICLAVDPDTQIGVCLAFCDGDAIEASCDEGFGCPIWGEVYTVLPVCEQLCDPLMAGSDCPEQTTLCLPGPKAEAFYCGRDWSGDSGAYGNECAHTHRCDPGLICKSVDDVPQCEGFDECCTPFCDMDAPNDCPDADQGQSCQTLFWNEPPPEWTHVGYCGGP